MHVRRLDDFDVTNLPGPRNPTDPLSRRGFADGDGPAPSTGDPDPERQQELFSLPLSQRNPRRRCSRPSALGGRTLNAPQRQPSPTSRRCAHTPPHRCEGGGGGVLTPPCPSMLVALAGSELSLSMGPRRLCRRRSPPTTSSSRRRSYDLGDGAGPRPDLWAHPSRRGGRAGQACRSARRPCHRKAGLFWCIVASYTAEDRAVRTASASPPAAGCARGCSAPAITARSRDTLGAPRRGRWFGAPPCRWARIATSRSCQVCQRTKAEHGGPRGLLHPLPELPLPSRPAGMMGADRIAGLPSTAAGFDMIHNHVRLLSGKGHAVPTHSTATSTDVR